jgi:hypothetical protein
VRLKRYCNLLMNKTAATEETWGISVKRQPGGMANCGFECSHSTGCSSRVLWLRLGVQDGR